MIPVRAMSPWLTQELVSIFKSVRNVLEFIEIVGDFEFPRFGVLCKDFIELTTLFSGQVGCGQSSLQTMNAHVFFIMPMIRFLFCPAFIDEFHC